MSGAFNTISEAMRWKFGFIGISGCAPRPSRRAKFAELFIVSRWVRSIRIDEMSAEVDARFTPEMMSALFSRAARAGRFLVRRDFGQGIDGRARGIAAAHAVAVHRDEQVRLELARDTVAFLEDEEPVVLTRQRHPDPARAEQFVADGAGDPERHVLFAPAIDRGDRAGIDAAMARIDHHQRAAVVIAIDLRQGSLRLDFGMGTDTHICARASPFPC